MNILALDLATTTGWAYKKNKKGRKFNVDSGIVNFSPKRGDSPGVRFLKFRAWLAKMVKDVKPEIVVYERPHHRGGAATEVLVGLSTRVQEIAAEYKIECQAVHSTTLKKFLTGSGKASKKDMINEAKIRFPEQNIVDDNQADALGLLSYAIEIFEYEDK